jgi:Zn-finger nucleic acid-binding protein
MGEYGMNCPKCQSDLHTITLEVAFMTELPTDIPNLTEIEQNAQTTIYNCPRCGAKLEEMKFVKNNDLLIDRCPQCQGIWLDKDELRKVEDIASRIGDVKSKIMLACKQLQAKGYAILEVVEYRR